MIVAFLPGRVLFRLSVRAREHADAPADFLAFRPGSILRAGLQTLFLAGNVASVLVPCTLALALMAIALFLRTAFATKTRLD